MRNLNYELKRLCLANREGSYGTQRERERTLTLIANQLDALGFKKMYARSLRPKHVERLVAVWKNGHEELGLKPVAIGTLKNRLADLRWWARKAHKPGVVAKDNETYGIADQKLVSQVSKAVPLNGEALERITDPYIRVSLLLQQAFGLRREEAIKFIPSYADRGDRIVLKATWTKGGKEREMPVRTESQREALQNAHRVAGLGSLISPDRNYDTQRRVYEAQTSKAGLSRMHGLRHEYAQHRYEELTGWEAPVRGGPSSRDLTVEQKRIDREVRLIISQELGHERTQVAAIYLGR